MARKRGPSFTAIRCHPPSGAAFWSQTEGRTQSVTPYGQTIEVFGQETTTANTMTGCLGRGGSPGFYLLREERTGLSAGIKVKLTGRLVREEGRDVFRVTNVEQLSPTCEITPQMELSVESIKDAVGRATLGVRGGIGLDPELIFLGGHMQVGPIVKGLWFRPSYEFGFGEVTKINSFNFDFAYYPDLTLRGRGTNRADSWNIYFGAGGSARVAPQFRGRGGEHRLW